MAGVERNQKKVSVIVPVYNAAAYLGRCMESLAAQLYGNVEIIFVDDGSTDGSGGICDVYAGRYGNVKVFHTENKGVSAARNLGLDVCSGVYLAFVDADDILAEDMVGRLVHMIEKSGSDVAGCGYFSFYDESQEKKGKRRKTKKEKRREKGAAAALQTEVLYGSEFIEKGILKSDTRCWSKLYRRESVGKLRFDTGLTVGEDMLFLLELARQGKKFCRCNYEGYGYCINEKGAMLKGFQDSFMDQITCWQRALGIIRKERPDLEAQGEAILLVSVMLAAGKLSALSRAERKGKGQYAARCFRLAKKYGGKREVFRKLDRGYRIKVSLYCCAPELYMALYRIICYVKALRMRDFILFFIDNFI